MRQEEVSAIHLTSYDKLAKLNVDQVCIITVIVRPIQPLMGAFSAAGSFQSDCHPCNGDAYGCIFL